MYTYIFKSDTKASNVFVWNCGVIDFNLWTMSTMVKLISQIYLLAARKHLTSFSNSSSHFCVTSLTSDLILRKRKRDEWDLEPWSLLPGDIRPVVTLCFVPGLRRLAVFDACWGWRGEDVKQRFWISEFRTSLYGQNTLYLRPQFALNRMCITGRDQQPCPVPRSDIWPSPFI